MSSSRPLLRSPRRFPWPRIGALGLVVPLTLSAATKFVAPGGSDSNDGETPATAYRTIAKGVREIGPGGRLFIRGGLYEESILNAIPAGLSDTARTTIGNYEHERVIIRPKARPARVLEFGGAVRFITFAANGRGEIVLDGTNVTANVVKFSAPRSGGGDEWPAHIRLQNLEIAHSPNSAVLGFPRNSEFIDLEIHHAGTSVFDHGMYIEGSDNLIEGCDIHENYARGIQIFMSGKHADTQFASRNVIRRCRIHHNGLTPGKLKPGIDADSGTGNRIHDNLIYANGQFGVMVQIGGAANEITNNTFYANGTAAILINSTAAPGTVIKNNLAWQNGRGPQLIDQRGDSAGPRKVLEPATSPFLSTDPASPDFLKIARNPAIPADCGATIGGRDS